MAANTYPNSHALLNKIFVKLNTKGIKNEEDFEIYDIDLIDNDKPNKIYMYITTILKEYPNIMVSSGITEGEYKNFSDELNAYIIDENKSNKNKSFCDLILFDIICKLRLDKLVVSAGGNIIKFNQNLLNNYVINNQFNIPTIKSGNIKSSVTIEKFFENEEVLKSFNIINNFIGDFTMSMEKKLKLYKILNFLFDKIYNDTGISDIKILFNKLINSTDIGCAPRTIIEGFKGGYNNKSGDIDYHICKANFKQTFKKVSAKSAREGAKMVAMKVLKDKKKSVKFSLKRMIGKKEKCYDYDVSIDKSGKIIIKNQS
jgi:hypothetical protein